MENIIELKSGSNRWQVLQPAIYLISILPGLTWSTLLNGSSSGLHLVVITLAVVLIQHGVNVLNDAIDWKKGADSEKELSWAHFHGLDLRVVKVHGLVSFLIGTLIGLSEIYYFQRFEVLYVAIPLLVLGYGYNASQWTLSYTSLGEWVTGLCYGPGVFGCMGYLLFPSITPTLVLGSIAFGFLAVAVLFSHQPPQVLSDFLAGKSSFAVRYGAKITYLISRTLCVSALCLLVFIFNINASSLIAPITLFVGFAITLLRLFKTEPSPKLILQSALSIVSLPIILKLLEGLV
jgi:1,4-dihydroxy-2-naphthoate octaprenyltransferase